MPDVRVRAANTPTTKAYRNRIKAALSKAGVKVETVNGLDLSTEGKLLESVLALHGVSVAQARVATKAVK